MPDRLTIRRFLAGSTEGGSGGLLVEHAQLLWLPDLPPPWCAAVRLAADVVLVRADPATDDRRDVRACILEELRAAGSRSVAFDPPELPAVAAIALTGVRVGAWDVWSPSDASATTAIRLALMGDDLQPPPSRHVSLDDLAHLADLDRHLDAVAERLAEGR